MDFIPAVIPLQKLAEFVTRRADAIRDWAYALQQLGQALETLPGITVHGVAPDYSGCYVCFYVKGQNSAEVLPALAFALEESGCSADACRLVNRARGFPLVADAFRFVLVTGPAKALALASALDFCSVRMDAAVPGLISA